MIQSGSVQVNGVVVTEPGTKVESGRDRITVAGKPLPHASPLRYYALHKPVGVITTLEDPEGRPTIRELLPHGPRLFPVGRLDADTSGLLILTNDTQFAERLSNPDYKIPKTYQVKTASLLTEEQLDQLRCGVTLQDGPTRPAVVQRLRDSAKYTFVEITITEGRNRQVRRMIEAIGSKVLKLVRTAIGPIRIGDQRIGTHRPLNPDEIRELTGVRGKR